MATSGFLLLLLVCPSPALRDFFEARCQHIPGALSLPYFPKLEAMRDMILQDGCVLGGRALLAVPSPLGHSK